MTDNIPIEKLYSHPVVQELLDKVESNAQEDLENIKIPYVIKNKVLMSPGVWNNFYYSKDTIKDAYLKTRWDSKEVRSLYADHEDRRSREWIGEIKNPRMEGDHLIGDLVIVDKSTAQKLAYGAKMGISPKVHGMEDNNEMVSFEFDNFSVVINPAVKTAYINNMEKVEAEENKKHKKKKEMEGDQMTKGTEETDKVLEEESQPEAPAEESPAEAENVETEETQENEEETQTNEEESKTNEDESEQMEEEAAEVEAAEEVETDNEVNKDAFDDAVGMVAEYLDVPVADVRKALEPLHEESSEAEADMATADIINQISKLAEMLRKKKKYPYPEKDMAKEEVPEPEEDDEEEMTEREAEMQKKIEELNARLDKVTAKLNEPDKKSVKTAELSQGPESAITRNPDAAMLNALQKMGGI